MDLNLRPANECAFDAVSLGEVMLRLDPGEGRIRTARSFRAWEGGGEYNVIRGLRKCFGLKTAVLTALADNEVGHLVEDFMMQGGVDTSLVKWMDTDGIGRVCRNGLNFTERGFGIRGAKGYDLNYRPSMWSAIGGQAKAQEVNKEIAQYVDVMIGNEEDFTACLGFQIEGQDESLKELNIDGYKKMINEAVKTYPNFKAVATTLRTVHTATVNDWSALCWADGEIYKAADYKGLEIMDRVGGGDSFASGLVYGLMTTGDAEKAVNYGAAHGALAMTTPGDTTMATKKEVEAIMGGAGARVQR